MHALYRMFKQCLVVLGFKIRILQITILSRGELPASKGVILKIWFVVLEEYHIMHSEK